MYLRGRFMTGKGMIMPTKAKQKKYNILMAVAIVIIAVCGIMAVGHLKGWFGSSEVKNTESALICSDTKGVVQVERSGVGYTLKTDTVMQNGDTAETKNESEAIFTWQDKNNVIAINENTEITFEKCSEETLSLILDDGELFGNMSDDPTEFNLSFGENTASATGAVISVSEKGGAGTLCVYKGSADVMTQDGDTHTVASGEQILLTANSKGEKTVEITKMKPDILSAYMINKLLSCTSAGICFTDEELNSVIDARMQEKADAAKALEKEAIKISEGREKTPSDDGEEPESYDEESEDTPSGDDSYEESQTGDNEGSDTPADTGDDTEDSSDNEPSEATPEEDEDEDLLTCTIMIRCDSILDHMEDLAEGKDRYVPENGIILYSTAVEFLKGETAYDVTKRACSAMGIQIEASYSPLYGSYYVEGIGNLYEFDCGGMSGWLYKVNGWAPNYGCSEYALEDGDSIVWEYTCTGN